MSKDVEERPKVLTHPTRRIVSSNPEESLRFVTQEEFEEFRSRERSLIAEYQMWLESKYGKWSDREDAYVKESPDSEHKKIE